MKFYGYLFVAAALVGALGCPPAQSQEIKAGDLVISQPWSRAAPKGAETASAYLTIENKGAAADRLVGATTDIAEKIQVEQVNSTGGALAVNPVEAGLAIAPGDKVVLAPGGYRLGLVNLKSAMKKGTKVPMTLQFEKAGQVAVTFDVLGAAAKGPAVPKADDGKMKK
jgi:copper(I)-binding protein